MPEFVKVTEWDDERIKKIIDILYYSNNSKTLF